MKHITLLVCLLLGLVSFAQNSRKIEMKFVYKGNPLCYWDVTLKYGDVEIARSKTDENGIADFGYVNVLSNSVDAYGVKKTSNGNKSWEVKGYIVLAESGVTTFDFQNLVEEMGMGGMLETAWGLNLNDCGKGAVSNSNAAPASTSGNSAQTQEPEEEEKSDFDKKMEADKAKRDAERAQREEDWQSGKTQAEAYQNAKAMHENRITSANNKIKLLNDQLAQKTPGTKAYSDIQYEIRETEIDRDLSQVKLDKTNRQIAKGNAPLTKSEKEDLVMREDLLNQEEDSLKKAKKEGALYGMNATQNASSKPETTKSEPTKSEPVSQEAAPKTEDDSDMVKLYTKEELKSLSVMELKKLKLDTKSKMGSRKLTLKTKKAMMKPEKITQFENDIVQMEEQVKRIDEELASRKVTE